MSEGNEFLGVGIYSVAEASRLTHVPSRSIRRWLQGYTFQASGERHRSGPVWDPQLPPIDDDLALGFLDLMEVRFVDAFRRHGVSWKAIRLAAERACEILGRDHPFSTFSFQTDGKTIFAEILREAPREPALLDLVRSQYAFRQVLAPYLYRGLEFSKDDVPVRWRPMPRNDHVVLDPKRQLGRPIVDSEGVPTAVLMNAYRVEESYDRVAQWFEVEPRSVMAAVRFEEYLGKAA